MEGWRSCYHPEQGVQGVGQGPRQGSPGPGHKVGTPVHGSPLWWLPPPPHNSRGPPIASSLWAGVYWATVGRSGVVVQGSGGGHGRGRQKLAALSLRKGRRGSSSAVPLKARPRGLGTGWHCPCFTLALKPLSFAWAQSGIPQSGVRNGVSFFGDS